MARMSSSSLQPGKEETYLPLRTESPLIREHRYARRWTPVASNTSISLPVFREQAAAGAKLFYEFDGHPNAEGYRLTA